MAKPAPAATWEEIDSLRAWDKNPRINDSSVEPVARSIARFGFGTPLVVRKQDRTIIAGHTRAKALRWLNSHVPRKPGKIDGAWRPRLDGEAPFLPPGSPTPTSAAVRFLDLTEAEAHALALADNRLGELAEWDEDLLTQVLAELAQEEVPLADLGWSDAELAKLLDPNSGRTPPDYTKRVKSPIYCPRGDRPPVGKLCDTSRTDKLLAEIEAAPDLPTEVRRFLQHAAQRHTAFDYEQIAEFYAHAPANIQQLMENSALVIIDFGKAIEQGFVVMNSELAEAYDESARVQDPE